jgi:adenylate cyclase class 2
METELEVKFLDINKDEVRKKLKDIGALLKFGERAMKRKVFDLPDGRLRGSGAWIRVRDEGDKITLSYKKLVDRSLYGTKEIMLEVSDFNGACDFLLASGFDLKSYQETKRETWIYKDTGITIDTWPWIPPFVEIESDNERELRDVVARMGLDWKFGLHGSVETAYQKYFDVTEEEIDGWEDIVFSEIPEWLEIRRRK